MRFSILLPTRNRLHLLREAIETVRRQDYADWEIVVSDNASEQDVCGYVDSLRDDRVKYVRLDRVVPVAENWNYALTHSVGDYFLMLGDDDGLVSGYFTKLERVLDRFNEPDLVYSRAYQFAHPGVMPDHPRGYVQSTGVARFLQNAEAPFLLDTKEARRVARKSLKFQLAYDYNMQHVTVRRRLVEALGGPQAFFRSVFPDYYAMNMLFLTARRIAVHPQPLTIIGISPKSFGFFHSNRREEDGMRMLHQGVPAATRLEGPALPGDDIKAGWRDAAREIERQLDEGLRAHERRLQRLRAFEAFELYRQRSLSRAELAEHFRLLRPLDRALVLSTAAAFDVISRRLHTPQQLLLRSKILRYLPYWDAPMIEGRFDSLLDVFENVDDLVTGVVHDGLRAEPLIAAERDDCA